MVSSAFVKEAIDRGVKESKWAAVDRPLYLVAAMTGLRQGELLALRWESFESRPEPDIP